MFGPQHLTHVIRYLDGVDYALSQRMLRKHPPDEPALTNELCALLDADTQRAEESLPYSVDQLNADLVAVGDDLDFEITLDTYPHNAAMERHVSQSDFGLVLAYNNRILPEESWSTAYLVQAKRLFRNAHSGQYDQRAGFQAVNADQQARLDRLSTILGKGSLRYSLYCPQTQSIPDQTRIQVRALRLFGIVSSDLIEIPNNLVHSLHISQLHLEQLVYVNLDVFSFARCRSGRARVQVGVDLNRLWHS